MMIWSRTETSRNLPASLTFLVRSISAWLGLRFPEGWLCDKIIAHAFSLIAATNISRGSATVWVVVPVDSSYSPITLWALFNRRTLNCSTNSILSSSQYFLRTSWQSLELVIFGRREAFYFRLVGLTPIPSESPRIFSIPKNLSFKKILNKWRMFII